MTTIAKSNSFAVLGMTPQTEFAQSVSSANIHTTEIEVMQNVPVILTTVEHACKDLLKWYLVITV